MAVTAPALDTFFATVPGERVLHSLPDGVSVTFDLRGDGGGLWTVVRDGDKTEIVRDAPRNADCRLRCTAADFQALLRGDLDARRGFLERRLEVEGDVGLVLALQRSVL